jgi:transposase
MSPDDRHQVRQDKSKPLVASLRTWFEHQLARVSTAASIAEHIRCGLNHWDELTRFLDYACIDIHIVERRDPLSSPAMIMERRTGHVLLR